ncbi:fimbria/pilus outer membrane usher protein [Burkholderia guangdongensis]|uniref:fimbria/pilus outer membrane usher protein n=1 Tax=Burkholderia guangdongensis TaxID=1792500 RepID=UPI0015C6E35E|nr:fimbria/pilus outer membrane usher protein [Burkholderia guangdongensis]
MRIRAAVICLCAWAVGDPGIATTFNPSFLNIGGMNDNVDLSRFEQPDFTPPGAYLLDVDVNDAFHGLQTIDFVIDGSSRASRPCLTPTLVAQFGLKPSLANELPGFDDGRCVDVGAIDGATVRYLKNDGRLRITIPQAALRYTDPSYVPPERWSDGIAGAMLDYRVVANAHRALGDGAQRSQSARSYGTIGANWRAWRLRGDYQAQAQANGGSAYAGHSVRFSRLYGFRALPSIASTLSIGDDYLHSDIFDTFALTGATLRSDDRMLPPALRGYAPLITGGARTSATVTVSQQGRVLLVTKVSPGPFALQNLHTSVQGTLDVAVEEEDGTVERFQVSIASVPYLSRSGQLRYKFAVGQPRHFGGTGITPFFGFAEAAYGLPLDVTVYGGVMAASRYTSAALGVGRDFGRFGALSADVTYTRARLWWNGAAHSGRAYRVNYSKRFDALDADVRFFGYRFSARHYASFAQFAGAPAAYALANSKQHFSATLLKRFGGTSAYLSYDSTAHWSRSPDRRIGVALARTFSFRARQVSVGVSAFRTQRASDDGNTVSLTVTLPLGQRRTLTSNLLSGSPGGTSVNAGYTHDDPDGRTFQLHGGATDGRASLNASMLARLPAVQLSAQASTVAGNYAAASLDVSGSLVATRYGVSAHANGNAGDTRLLVSTDGVPNVPLAGARTQTGARGYATLDDLLPYEAYDAAIDVERLPLDVHVDHPIRRVVLTEGAIGFVAFPAARGRTLYVTLGPRVPFGASVQDADDGRELGIVGEQGAVYLTRVRPDARLVVRSAAHTLCTLGALPDTQQLDGTPIPVACRSPDPPRTAATPNDS